MRSVRLPSSERRAAIINAAIEVFSERGFHGSTTKELASRVGVSEPVLYQHFSNKGELYGAILERLASTAEVAIPLVAPPEGRDREFLTTLANGIIDWHRKNPAFVRLMLLSALEGHEFHDLLHRKYVAVFFDEMKAYFADRMERGIFRKVDPICAAQSFAWAIGQFALQLTVLGNGVNAGLNQEKTVDQLIDIFMQGIQA